MADLTNELVDLLGEDDFVVLAEKFGGTRLFVPGDIRRSELPAALGDTVAQRLSNLYRGSYIRVPLAREIRAARYRQAGMTNRDIARNLGITETSVNKLVRRGRTAKPEAFAKRQDPRQLSILDLLE